MQKYCDLSCEYARFPDKLSDGSGSCGTFIGLYCKKLKQTVTKNGPCLVEIEKRYRTEEAQIQKKENKR